MNNTDRKALRVAATFLEQWAAVLWDGNVIKYKASPHYGKIEDKAIEKEHAEHIDAAKRLRDMARRA